MTDRNSTAVWKLGIVTALAACYLGTSLAIDDAAGPAPAPDAEVAPRSPSTTARAPATAARHPTLAPAPAVARIARAHPPRRVRVRTRSS